MRWLLPLLVGFAVAACGQESVLTLSAMRTRTSKECALPAPPARKPGPAQTSPGPRTDGKDGHGGVAMDWAAQHAKLAAWVQGPGSTSRSAGGVPADGFIMGGENGSQPESAAERARLERSTQARELYLRGYILRASDPRAAIGVFRQVLSLTPPSDEYHQKARARIEELQR